MEDHGREVPIGKPSEGGRRPRKKSLVERIEMRQRLDTLDDIDRVRDVRDRYLVHHDDTLIVPRPEEPGASYTGYLDQETLYATAEIDRALRVAIAHLINTLNEFQQGKARINDASTISSEVERRLNEARRHMARLSGIRDGLYHAKAKADREAEDQVEQEVIEHDAEALGLAPSEGYVWCHYVGAIVDSDVSASGHDTCAPEDHVPVYLPKAVEG